MFTIFDIRLEAKIIDVISPTLESEEEREGRQWDEYRERGREEAESEGGRAWR